MIFSRKHPEFHTLVVDVPLSSSAREDKQVLGQDFVNFIEVRLRREPAQAHRFCSTTRRRAGFETSTAGSIFAIRVPF
jgi:hypothetical protein